MTHRKITSLTLAAGLLVLAGTACARPMQAAQSEPGLEGWERNHPDASRDLGAWVRTHPDAAHKLFDWDAAHPERAHEFVTWSIAHPGEGTRAFAAAHPDWGAFDDIARAHQPATNAFMGWARHYPDAAEALMRHPGGLSWAGHHIYATDWK